MIFFDMLKKAHSAMKHPGVGGQVGFMGLLRRAAPYFLSPGGYSGYPLTIYFSINSICNLKCKMCDVGNQNAEANFYKNLRLDGNRGQIAFEEFTALVDQVKHFKPMIGITSTEPLLYRDIVKCVDYVNQCGMEMLITTGGYLLPRYAEDFVRVGLKRLYVSIDGPPAIHNSIRGVKDTFERATEGIRTIARIKKETGAEFPKVFINYTISNHNYFCLEDFMESIADLELERVNFTLMNFVTQEMADEHNATFGADYAATVNCLGGGTNPDEVDVDVLWSQLEGVKAKYGEKVEILPHINRKEMTTYFSEPSKFLNSNRCMVSYFIAQIIANGDVIPYTRCYNVSLGNVREQSFDEIWNGPKMRKFRRDLRKHGRLPACTRCDQIA